MTALTLPRSPALSSGALILVLLFALRLATPATATAAFAGLALYALTGRRQAIHALLFSWLFALLNPGLAPSPFALSLLRYLVLFAAGASVFCRSDFYRGRGRVSHFAFLTLCLGAFMVVHGLVISPEPLISILKAVAWTLALMTSLAAWSSLDPDERALCAREVMWVLIGVAVVSLLLASQNFAYMRAATRLLRGVLAHSQALGGAMALLAAWVLALMLERVRWPLVGALALILVLIVLSGARTALLAAMIGVVCATVLTPWLTGRRLTEIAPAFRSGKMVFLATLGSAVALVWSEPLQRVISDFFRKGRDLNSILAAYDDSRGGLIAVMVENIARYPLTGIGFGIASDPQAMTVQRIAGIPVGATVEKGVTPIAVVEELGIPGAVLAGVWLLSMVLSGARGGLVPLAVLIAILALNMGEATLFSPGGMGMLSIVLIGWSVSSAGYAPRPRAWKGAVQ